MSEPTPEYAIETHGLAKQFGDVRAVAGLDLAVRRGELFALLGVNGAGKTTTIRMLATAAGARERTAALLEALSLSDVAERRAKVLSGGYQRRLSIALALASDPEVLYLDEPTLGLDVLARRELWHLIGRLRGEKTIVLTTHYLEEAEALSDRVGVMAGGRLLAVDTPDGLKKMTGCEKFEDAFIRLVGGEVEA